MHNLNPDVVRYIREEIKKQLNIILCSYSADNDTTSEEIDQLFPGMPKESKRPVVHPYGFCSRAPSGTLQVHARVGEHIANRIILGHRDAARKDLTCQQGEVVLYNQYGQEIQLQDGKINLGKNADEPAVLGNVLKTLLSDILDKLIAGNTALSTTPGNPTAPNPAVAAELTQLKTQYLTTASSNILSGEVFVERGE